MIRNAGIEPQVVLYLETPPSRATLKALFAHDSRVDVRPGDGYALLRSLLPPKFNGSKIGRGLVLIDPPYEAQDAEYQNILAALAETLARWPQATCAVPARCR
ncbi:hypothetical protein G6F24_018497 [Rhizopus arrhizus]|nr:hypothetical protein G6F24_018497 [Rhizopus arrhizus]